eukprot:TRINITY_DN50706_c0_g1_i1.p1 TRINITY_DN50706_c0_g1~~TRINITY_DN50706_c0_g1_i1.p1  ORF type:complete len:339 (+),score=4.92 TRINITY_DN50706_c0_g1_i1:75-1091(+)
MSSPAELRFWEAGLRQAHWYGQNWGRGPLPVAPKDEDFGNVSQSQTRRGPWRGRMYGSGLWVFLGTEPEYISHVQWRGDGSDEGVAEMRLYAFADGWLLVSQWKAVRTPDMQMHTVPRESRVCASSWRLVMLSTHGETEHVALDTLLFLTPGLPKEEPRCVENRLAVQPCYQCGYQPRSSLGIKLLSDGKFTDVGLLCGERTVKAHRSVLAASSTVFMRMLETEMRESLSSTIIIEGADSLQYVEKMVQFMYTGKLAEVSCGTECASLIRLGHTYDVAGLVDTASCILVKLLCPGNVAEVVKILRPYADDALVYPLWLAVLSKIQRRSSLIQALVASV